MEPQERHYNINKLNVIFALSSIMLLLSIFWMVKQDYDRQWKDYQKDFHRLEVEKARVQLDATSNALEADPEYQELQAKLQKAQDEYASACPNLEATESKIAELQAQEDLLQQKYKFSKAEMDAAKYRYEDAKLHKDKDLPQIENEFEDLKARTKELKLETEQLEQEIAQKQEKIDACAAQVKELERQKRQLAMHKELVERKLQKIDTNAMSFTNRIAQIARDLPIIDFANPKYKIEQVVLNDLRDDVNFMTVPKVERCITCHLGISDPDYEDAPQPFTTHPNLELFVNKDSPHPLEEFGCTTCHGGRPRATDFVAAAHTPSSPKQEKAWKEKYDWHKIELWEDPMLPLPYVEAGCFKCHSGQSVIPQAEKLNLGLHLIEKSGCYGCHNIDKYKDWPKAGPDLRKLSSKVSKEWAYHWITDPHAFRHDTWMPAFFNQSNTDDPVSKARAEQEIHAMVHYLFAHNDPYDPGKIPFKGDREKGKELVASLGCFACHQMDSSTEQEETTRDLLRRQHGPNLTGLGSKTSKEWVYGWIKDPNRYHPATRMPNLRLSEREAADIAAYLIDDEEQKFMERPVPKMNTDILNEIVLGFLRKIDTDRTARSKMADMDHEQKLNYAGEKLIAHYGCYGCHEIAGFENVKPVGTDLTEEGSKSVHKLDFGFIDIDHTRHDWFAQKLKDPRIFDRGKVKAPDEKLKMPNFYFTRTEVDAIVTALLGFVDDRTVENKKMPRTARNLYIEEGQKISRQFNCQGCHIMEGEGGTIQGTIEDWLVEYQERSESEAEAVVTSFSPPNLIGEGKKVRSKWLFEFLHEPTVIRPWLKVRMPTFRFNVSHFNALVKYFNALDNEEFPFNEPVDTSMTEKEYEDAKLLFSKEYFGCAQCHIVGDKLPSGSPDSWAPNFALAKTRLKPDWIIEWLKNPQELLPGTKMPTYFDESNFENSGPDDLFNGDENVQIRMLRNYLLTISESPQSAPEQVAPAAASPVASDFTENPDQ